MKTVKVKVYDCKRKIAYSNFVDKGICAEVLVLNVIWSTRVCSASAKLRSGLSKVVCVQNLTVPSAVEAVSSGPMTEDCCLLSSRLPLDTLSRIVWC